jgi:hypothetical protein
MTTLPGCRVSCSAPTDAKGREDALSVLREALALYKKLRRGETT